ncbi:hypothetical protein [Pseudoalteromonas rubra]|uniref:Uncharacterized protein n=1 Tax=Pseudoalteromonas rubra TaxID=43658 RepID=A0A0U2P4D3_9GAMM|nr:hypothetical protein [Pseudoalteromonas rubra]ALU41981.1 hypothetical protein AT705_02950 [Pseudoalteromonas rubra]
MATKTFEVTSYQIKIGFELSGGGSRAVLACLGEDGHRFNVYFSSPGSEMSPPHYSPHSKFGAINVSISEMQHYVDLVRNEKPIYAYLNSDKPLWNNISTSKEPVGEEESWRLL